MLGIPNRGLVVGASVVLVGLAAGCGGSYSNGGVKGATKTAQKFHAANVAGVGRVLVDAKGRTVYVLTNSSTMNVPCTGACTGVWPPVSPMYKGWRVYEYTGDSGPGQANGEGIKSFGGTWYALSPAGQPVKKSSSGGGGGGYGY